jgi:hypothetical protein
LGVSFDNLGTGFLSSRTEVLTSKTSSDKTFLKNLLPEVGEVASGREFLAVLDVVLYDRPEASGVSGLGQIAGQRGGVL